MTAGFITYPLLISGRMIKLRSTRWAEGKYRTLENKKFLIFFLNLMGREHFGEIDLDGRILLKRISYKEVMKMLTSSYRDLVTLF
jgi:hypothetical protein